MIESFPDRSADCLVLLFNFFFLFLGLGDYFIYAKGMLRLGSLATGVQFN